MQSGYHSYVDVTFETAVDAIVNGDLPLITDLVNAEPALPRATASTVRASRHAAALPRRQRCGGRAEKSPPNAPQIARLLLAAGAVPDALAEMYGGRPPPP